MTRLTAFSLPGTGDRRDDDGVAALDLDGLVIAVGHPRKRRERLALASRAQHDDVLGGEPIGIVCVDDVVVVDLEIAELAGDLGVGDHGAPGDDDLAAGVDRRVADLLHAMDVAGERGDDDALLGGLDDVAQAPRRLKPPSS